MNEIPFLNLPHNMGWGTKYQKIADYYRGQGCLKSERNNVIEITGVWNNVEFQAWLSFSKYLKNLYHITLDMGNLHDRNSQNDVESNDEFVKYYNILEKNFKEPAIKKGISIGELKQLENIRSVEVDALPYFEWHTRDSKLILKYTDHWEICPEIILIPREKHIFF